MLLPPIRPQELAAFNLTSLEKEMKLDIILPPDLGIPLNALDIEQYSVSKESSRGQGHGHASLHPVDKLLVQEGNADLAARPRREGAVDAHWLLRTKYITSSNASTTVSASESARKKQQVMSGGKSEVELLQDTDTIVKEIEASFEAVKQPPKHPKNPNAVPIDVLPILPDNFLEGRSLVQASFDGDPGADIERLASLSSAVRWRLLQASQLKSFIKRKSDGSQDRFVAFLLPLNNSVGIDSEDGSGEDNKAGEAVVSIRAEHLCGDYEWIREYDSQVRFDERGQTYLFRIGKDHIGYSDLNTKVVLRKRKRGSRDGEGDDQFLQPEKFILEFPVPEEEQKAEQGAEEMQKAEEAPVEAPATGELQRDEVKDSSQQDDGKMAFTYERPANRVLANTMKNVFGSDDEDEED